MLIVYLILFLAVMLSGLLIFLVKTDDRRILKLLLAFSGAFLIGISFLKLVPEIYTSPARYAGLFILLGFLIQLVLELLTEGVEHGHRHVHYEGERVSPFLLLTGLCIHAFLEGLPINESFNADLRQSLITGIVIHNIPISLTLMSLFIHYGCSKTKALIYLGVFALMTPIGSVMGHILPFDPANLNVCFNYALAVVVGIFLHVSTSILFETEENHRYNLQKFMIVCVGLFTAFGIAMI
ncbi:MAG: ZIP family metal transporter [Bacteroidota bacterium]|nr:ZIP family metal transporter [Bacteroidota bacterium]